MRRNVGIAIAIAVVLALALVVSNVTLAAGSDTAKNAKADDRDHVQTIQLTATLFANKDFDLDPSGLSLGDYFVVTEDLFRQGKKVGTDHAICTITRLEPPTGTPKRGALQCVVTLVLPEGQITVQGVRTGSLSQQQPPRFTLAITGGTGAYKTAHGQVRIVDINATDSRLTLTLIL
jgi:hypothetical protein